MDEDHRLTCADKEDAHSLGRTDHTSASSSTVPAGHGSGDRLSGAEEDESVADAEVRQGWHLG
jgi:hypothetical protein